MVPNETQVVPPSVVDCREPRTLVPLPDVVTPSIIVARTLPAMTNCDGLVPVVTVVPLVRGAITEVVPTKPSSESASSSRPSLTAI